MSETEDLMHAWRIGALVVKKAMHRGGTDSEASEEAEIGAGSGHLGSKEAEVYLKVKQNYLFHV